MWDVIEEIKDTPMLDAFRIWARKIAINQGRNEVTDFFHYVLHHADNNKQEPDSPNKRVRTRY
jgi:hypothetical protein